jgi:hypothetical protein
MRMNTVIYNLWHDRLYTCLMSKLFQPKRIFFADLESIHPVLILKIKSQPEKLQIFF